MISDRRPSMYQKLIIGIDQTTDVDTLLSLGVRQFYFGYLPTSFLEKYSSQISINRRYRESEQFCDLTQLLDIISKIHQKGAIVYLALNAMSSNEKLLEYTKEVYTLLHKEVDGIIVANITLATFLKNQHYPNIILSNLFGIYTVQSAQFFIKQFAPKKVILPRDISLETVGAIASHFPNTAFEVFLYGDNCRYSESFCFAEHGYDSIEMPSLCTFASENKIPISKPDPAYKQIVNNTTLLVSDKKVKFQKKYMDVKTLLDEIEVSLDTFNSKKIAENFQLLSRYDIEYLKRDSVLMSRLKNLCKRVDLPSSSSLCEEIKSLSFAPVDSYKQFHKLNASAIKSSIKYFEKYPNITSYKIPARGRNIIQFLEVLTQDDTYNYTQSQYKSIT